MSLNDEEQVEFSHGNKSSVRLFYMCLLVLYLTSKEVTTNVFNLLVSMHSKYQ